VRRVRRLEAGTGRVRRTTERPRVTVRGVAIFLVVVAVAALAAVGVARLRVQTTVDSSLARNDPAVADLVDHARSFGGNPVVVILESDEPRDLLVGEGQLAKLIRLEGELARLPDVAAVYGPGTVLNQIATVSQNLLVRIGGTRDALRASAWADAQESAATRRQAKAAADAVVADFDRRYGALIARGLPAGLPTMKNPKFAETVIYGEAGDPRPRWHFVVPDQHSVAVSVRPRQDIDEDGNRRLVAAVEEAVGKAGLQTSRVTVTGVPAITSALSDEAVGEIPLLGGLAILVLLMRFLVAPAGGGWLRRVWPLVAAFSGSVLTLAGFGWAGVSLSFAAVMLLPLLLGIGSSFPLYLATAASRREVIVVSLASAAAFGSLAFSPLPFVRELGLALGIGVVLTVAATVVMGRVLVLTPEASPVPVPAAPAQRLPATGRRWAVLGCLIFVAGCGWAVLPRLDVVADPESMAHGLPELDKARYAEQVLGSSGEVSIVLRGADVESPAALDWLIRAQDVTVARHGDQLRPILTAPDLLGFLGDQPTAEQIAAGVRLLPPYLSSAVLTPDGGKAVLIFGLKLQDLGRQSHLLADVQSALPPPPPGTSVRLVGLPVAASHTYQEVSNDRVLGNLAGVVAAGLVLLLGLRNRWYAGSAVLAAVLATGWTFAGLWLLGQSLTPLTIALGSLATVTACEFTVLLAESRRLRLPGLAKTVVWACATSMVGYLALIPSRIGLLREFGITLAVTMLLSYLAAVAVVRLSGRGGRREPGGGADSGEPAPVAASLAKVR
jgi:uncharacterized protein